MILFEILKIIGYILLILICVIAALILLILFIPLLYHFKIDSENGFVLKGKVRVLLGLISADIVSDSNEKYSIKLLGIPLKVLNSIQEDGSIDDKNLKAEEELFNMSVNLNASDSSVQKEDEVPEEEKNIFDKIADKILQFIYSLKEKIINLINVLKNLKDKIDRIIEFISDENVLTAFSNHKSRLFKILTHIGPVKSDLHIEFGTEDPSSVGYILAAISPFYGLYGKWLTIEPRFDEKIFKAKGDVRGRVFLIILLWHFIRVYFDKHVKTIRNKYKTSD